MANVRRISNVARTVGTTATGRRIVAASMPSLVRPGSRPASAQPARFSYPIHLFAEADVPAGAEATVRSSALTNRLGVPLEIREIRVGALAGAAAAAGKALMDAGGLIRVSLSVNGKPITHGYVPMWCLGVTEDYYDQVSIWVTGTNFGAWAQYVWRLSRPWYLPAGAEVAAQFQNMQGGRFTITGQIGLAGRTAPKAATTSCIPYAAAWASQPVLDTDTTTEESAETDLLNVTGRMATIDRIIARVASRFTTVISAQNILIFNDTIGWPNLTSGVELNVFTSDHRAVTKGFIGVAEVFGPRRAIEVVHQFAPGDFYRASLRKTAAVSSGANDFYSQAFVSVLGYREEPV